jgi:hypothetical protein
MFSSRAVSSIALLLVAILAIAAIYANENHRGYPASPPVYEAPLVGADDAHRAPGGYFVKLQKNHFEKHIALIGTQRHVQFRILEDDTYVATKVEDSLLAAIRADPGVLSVKVDRLYSMDELMERPVPNPA